MLTPEGIEFFTDCFLPPDMPHAFIAFDCGITRTWFEHQARWLEARL